MSSFQQAAYHPKEKVVRGAYWLDDYFGLHQYGVRFDDPDDDDGSVTVFTPSEVVIPLDRVFVDKDTYDKTAVELNTALDAVVTLASKLKTQQERAT